MVGLPLGVANLQPSELMKLFVTIYVADYTVRKAAYMGSFKKGFAPMFVVMLFVGGLLLREPDFGAFAVITVIAMGILFLGGMNWRLFVGLALLLLGAALMVAIARDAFPDRRRRATAEETLVGNDNESWLAGCFRSGR